MSIVQTQPLRVLPSGAMTVAEARSTTEAVNRTLVQVGEWLYELRERRGWEVLGYESFRAFLLAEITTSLSHAYREVKAFEIFREVEPDAEPSSMPPERVLRPMSVLEPGERGDAWETAKAAAPDGKPTSPIVEAAVAAKTGKAKVAKPEPVSPTGDNPAPGRSIVDGVEQDDPPDIAEQRAAGLIPANAIPSIETGEATPTPAGPVREAGEDEPETDEEWLGTLPAREKLKKASLRRFDAEALLYRHVAEARRVFAEAVADHISTAVRSGAKGGAFLRALTGYLRVEDPRNWAACRKDGGGCGGEGAITTMDQTNPCEVCHGRGYRVR